MTLFNARSRLQTYSMIIGVVMGIFTAGVAVPLIFAEPARTVSAGPSLLGAGDGGFTGDTVPGAADGDATTTGDAAAVGAGGTTGATGTAGTAGAGGTGTGATGLPGSSSGGGAAGGGPAAKPSGPAIKVGIMILDLANVTALGFPATGDVESTRKVWQHWVDQLNAAGGINGRPVEAVFTTYDPLSQSSMREACLYLTENKKVFLAIASGGFIGPPMLCFTEEHGTPLLVAGSSGVPQDFYTRSRGLLFTTFMGSDRTVLNFAQELDQAGVLKGKKVGLLFDLRSGPESIIRKLEAELKARGFSVLHTSVFSADFGTAAGQVPLEVQQHSTKGVDVIVNMSHALVFSQFVQDATSKGYVPPYFNSDWNGANSDFYYSNLPDSYNGNVSFTITRSGEHRGNYAEPEIDTQCRTEASKALGREVRRDAEVNFTRECAFLTLMARGLAAAGATATAASFSSGLRSAGRINLASFGGVAFGANRYDGGDHYRTLRWQANCKCIVPVSGFRPTRY